jgi:hypothetical protein
MEYDEMKTKTAPTVSLLDHQEFSEANGKLNELLDKRRALENRERELLRELTDVRDGNSPSPVVEEAMSRLAGEPAGKPRANELNEVRHELAVVHEMTRIQEGICAGARTQAAVATRVQFVPSHVELAKKYRDWLNVGRELTAKILRLQDEIERASGSFGLPCQSILAAPLMGFMGNARMTAAGLAGHSPVERHIEEIDRYINFVK